MSIRGTKIGWEGGEDSWEEMNKSKNAEEKLELVQWVLEKREGKGGRGACWAFGEPRQKQGASKSWRPEVRILWGMAAKGEG